MLSAKHIGRAGIRQPTIAVAVGLVQAAKGWPSPPPLAVWVETSLGGGDEKANGNGARLTPFTAGRDNRSLASSCISDTAAEDSPAHGSSARPAVPQVRRALVCLRDGLTLPLHQAHALLCNKLPCR